MLSKTMQKIFSFFLFFTCYIVGAREQSMSPLPIPEQEIATPTIEKCNKSCLNKLYENEQFFSFIAAYRHTKDKVMLEKYQNIATELQVQTTLPSFDSSGGLRVALLLPQKNIGRYTTTSADTMLAYLIARGNDFVLKAFDSQNEEVNNIVTTYNRIQEEQYDIVIAIITPKGLENLLQNTTISSPLFIPTINQKQASKFTPNQNVFFGGIDYEKQVDMMLELATRKQKTIISLNDDGAIGKMIGTILQSRAKQKIITESIDSKKSTNFAPIITKMRATIKNSMVMLNTSVIKSGLIVPQIGNARAMPTAFLSTQINYNLSLLNLMPKEDAKKLFVINAMSPVHTRLLLFNEILSTDLQYDWVNYATALSLDVFLAQNGNKQTRFFTESLENNQILYNNRFYGAQDSHFIPVRLK